MTPSWKSVVNSHIVNQPSILQRCPCGSYPGLKKLCYYCLHNEYNRASSAIFFFYLQASLPWYHHNGTSKCCDVGLPVCTSLSLCFKYILLSFHCTKASFCQSIPRHHFSWSRLLSAQFGLVHITPNKLNYCSQNKTCLGVPVLK